MFLCIWSDSRLWCIFLLTPLPKVLLVLSLSSLCFGGQLKSQLEGTTDINSD